MKSKVRSILFLISRYPGYGGIETVTTLLANHWVCKYKVVICSIVQQEEEKLLQNLKDNVAFYRMPYNGVKESHENVVFLSKIIESEQIDTVIYQDSYFPCQYLLTHISRYKHLNIIEVEHSQPSGFEIHYKESLKSTSCWNFYSRFKAWFNYQKSLRNEKYNRRLIYGVCDKYVMLAKGLIPQCQRYGGFSDGNKFEVIGNPVSIDNSDFGFTSKKKECLFVGRIDSMKGIDRLMRIWSNVEKTVDDWRLVIVGDGIKMSDVRNAINVYRLERVRIEGFQTNVKSYYETASILCMCSMYEGFPMVLPEAMSFGVVPIAFNSFVSLDEILIDGEDGILINPFDERLYYESLKNLMLDKNRLVLMQHTALEHSKKFSVTSVLGQWEKLFNG